MRVPNQIRQSSSGEHGPLRENDQVVGVCRQPNCGAQGGGGARGGRARKSKIKRVVVGERRMCVCATGRVWWVRAGERSVPTPLKLPQRPPTTEMSVLLPHL
jgi:hypothetical protein